MAKIISYLYIAILSLAIAGCIDSDSLDANNTPNSDPGADETLPGDEGASTTDRTDEVYAPSRLLKVEIELSPNDWDALRNQERTGEDLNIGADCLPPSEPFESPFSWFSGIVTVNGERLTNVGVRKKGFIGSMNEDKPSFKIRFDKFEEDQTYLDAKRLTLNNDVQDPSYVRQCLAYDLFRAVGTPAPRCNYAHVFVNGVDMGVYTNVESIKKPFVRRNFSDPEGNLYEGTLSDFREGWMGTFNQKTNSDTPDRTAIYGLAEVLQGPDETLIEGISSYVDLDAFLNFWVVETLTAHWDGYAGNTNNYHMYHDPTSDRLHFIPWGVDQTFQSTFMLFEGRLAPHSINTAGLLTRRLYLHPEGQAMYLERLTEVMEAYWDPEALSASIASMRAVFERVVVPLGPEWPSVEEAVSETIAFIDRHDTALRAELADGPVEWAYPLRETLCDNDRGGAEWNANLDTSETVGEIEYERTSTDGSGDCFVAGQLEGIASIELCGDGCTFAMEMMMTNWTVQDEANSGCSEEERNFEDGPLLVGQSTVQVGEFDGSPVWALMGVDEATGNWGPIPNGYSLSFGGGDRIIWYFGARF